jgi:outer membrane protein assembly factor BamE (lipoprotein component of BamABCDE complex)
MLGRILRLAVLALALLAAGCDYTYGPNNLKPGASLDEVRRQMGAATDEKRNADGSRVWWYMRGPQGFHTYKIAFDKDEKMVSVTQVLTEQSFRNITAGKSKDDVLELIGRPREQQKYPNRQEEVWTWRYQDGTFNKYIHVSFNTDGVVQNYVLETESTSPP